jgi:hypothetical protein
MSEQVFIHCRKDSNSNVELDHTPQSFDDENRKELPWENREEKLLSKWCDDCKKRSLEHGIHGKKNKIRYAVFSIPSIFIPIVLGGFASIVKCQSIIYSLGMMSSGLFSGVCVFFNFGKKMQFHNEYSNKYFELSNEIESELIKPKCHRISCHVYMEKIKLRYNGLVSHSPTL